MPHDSTGLAYDHSQHHAPEGAGADPSSEQRSPGLAPAPGITPMLAFAARSLGGAAVQRRMLNRRAAGDGAKSFQPVSQAGHEISTQTKATDGDGGGGAGGQENLIYSQAAWYTSSGRALLYDEVLKVVEVLNRYSISEGGTYAATFLFDAAGQPRGLKEFKLKADKGDKEIPYVNNYDGEREQTWSYWFTDGKKLRYLKQEKQLTTGKPEFTKDTNATAIPADLAALDLAFIPGTKSCFRAVYAMDEARGDQKANGGGVKRAPFSHDKRKELLDDPLAAGHRIHVRTTGHSILVLANLGNDKYQVDDPGRNLNGSLKTPEGTFTYDQGTLKRSDGNKDYPILEVESFK